MIGIVLGIAAIGAGVSVVSDETVSTGEVAGIALGWALGASLLGMLFARTMGIAAMLAMLVGPIGFVVGLADGRPGPAFAAWLFTVLGMVTQHAVATLSPFVLKERPAPPGLWLGERAQNKELDRHESTRPEGPPERYCRSCHEVVYTSDMWCPWCSARLSRVN